MNKKQFAVSLLAFQLICTPLLHAEEEHPIDKSLRKCMDKSESVTVGMKNCFEEACKKWEREVSKYLKLLMNILDSDDAERLRQSQSAWAKFKDLEFEFIPHSFKVPGSYAVPSEAAYKMEIIKTRALQLQAYYEQAKEGQELYKSLKKDK